ncbi:TIR domain-containing protein [Devosia faecipullorum]|uniref:TIR domain-containing protein n=1 Tax=Devosia faecipullorum TaxID=2755039 RepID=UPI00187B196B|nr:TIR domain-containing protein [Devosia faecipullorum]MBE7731675.1 TIR domain-containing protein [Devosia faecipullorum]
MSGLGLSLLDLSIRRKVFVSYHHGGDQAYYDVFTTTFHDNYQLISDTSLERRVDSDDPQYVMRRIREDYITGSSCTIVLVGSNTAGRKYVDWEIDASLQKAHGLIGVQLPSLPVSANGIVQVPPRLNDNIKSGYAVWVHWSHITSNETALRHCIEQANAASALLIDNTRERRYRNA